MTKNEEIQEKRWQEVVKDSKLSEEKLAALKKAWKEAIAEGEQIDKEFPIDKFGLPYSKQREQAIADSWRRWVAKCDAIDPTWVL
jgi:hypothetical protein